MSRHKVRSGAMFATSAAMACVVGCAFQAGPFKLAAGDAYVLTCEGEECDEVRGGHGSQPLFGSVGKVVDAAASFVGAGPPAPPPTIVVQPNAETARHTHPVGEPE